MDRNEPVYLNSVIQYHIPTRVQSPPGKRPDSDEQQRPRSATLAHAENDSHMCFGVKHRVLSSKGAAQCYMITRVNMHNCLSGY